MSNFIHRIRLRLSGVCAIFAMVTVNTCFAQPTKQNDASVQSVAATSNPKFVTLTHTETGVKFEFPKDNFRRDRETGCTWVADLDESHYNIEFAKLPKVFSDEEQKTWLKEKNDKTENKTEDKPVKMGKLNAREYLFVNELGTTKIRFVISPTWTYTFMFHCDTDSPQKTQARNAFFKSIQHQ